MRNDCREFDQFDEEFRKQACKFLTPDLFGYCLANIIDRPDLTLGYLECLSDVV